MDKIKQLTVAARTVWMQHLKYKQIMSKTPPTLHVFPGWHIPVHTASHPIAMMLLCAQDHVNFSEEETELIFNTMLAPYNNHHHN